MNLPYFKSSKRNPGSPHLGKQYPREASTAARPQPSVNGHKEGVCVCVWGVKKREREKEREREAVDCIGRVMPQDV